MGKRNTLKSFLPRKAGEGDRAAVEGGSRRTHGLTPAASLREGTSPASGGGKSKNVITGGTQQ
jgi:hypothetical protein